MKTFRVDVEVRNQGAIGVFFIKQYRMKAFDARSARTKAFDQAHTEGYETRNISAHEMTEESKFKLMGMIGMHEESNE